MDEYLIENRLDKTVFSVASLSDESDEKAYWLSRSHHERLQAIELLRQNIYGYDPASTRLQRVLTITELK
jgi:hypothetical protein